MQQTEKRCKSCNNLFLVTEYVMPNQGSDKIVLYHCPFCKKEYSVMSRGYFKTEKKR